MKVKSVSKIFKISGIALIFASILAFLFFFQNSVLEIRYCIDDVINGCVDLFIFMVVPIISFFISLYYFYIASKNLKVNKFIFYSSIFHVVAAILFIFSIPMGMIGFVYSVFMFDLFFIFIYLVGIVILLGISLFIIGIFLKFINR